MLIVDGGIRGKECITAIADLIRSDCSGRQKQREKGHGHTRLTLRILLGAHAAFHSCYKQSLPPVCFCPQPLL
jgi:hypothetical protein